MAVKANITVDQGTTFLAVLNLTDSSGYPLNLAGYTANAQMKRWYTSSNVITFNTSINNIVGTISLELDANVTATILPGRYVYDVDVTDGVSVSRLLEGLVYVTPGVTNSNNNSSINTLENIYTNNYLLTSDGSRILAPDGSYIIISS